MRASALTRSDGIDWMAEMVESVVSGVRSRKQAMLPEPVVQARVRDKGKLDPLIRRE